MSESRNTEHRRAGYKNKGVFKQDELRRRREEQQVEIRKQKREESLAKRRNLSGPNRGGDESDDDEAVAGQLDAQVSFNSFQKGLAMIWSHLLISPTALGTAADHDRWRLFRRR